jgi:hypothetical protein
MLPPTYRRLRFLVNRKIVETYNKQGLNCRYYPKIIVPLTTKPKKMTVAFATIAVVK